MEWTSCLSRSTLIERAKEELEILEVHHPNNFQSMKLELKAFISQLEDSQDFVSMPPSSPPSAATQESTSIRKRKRRRCPVVEPSNPKAGKSRTDAVLERAQTCLHKIQHLKTTFF